MTEILAEAVHKHGESLGIQADRILAALGATAAFHDFLDPETGLWRVSSQLEPVTGGVSRQIEQPVNVRFLPDSEPGVRYDLSATRVADPKVGRGYDLLVQRFDKDDIRHRWPREVDDDERESLVGRFAYVDMEHLVDGYREMPSKDFMIKCWDDLREAHMRLAWRHDTTSLESSFTCKLQDGMVGSLVSHYAPAGGGYPAEHSFEFSINTPTSSGDVHVLPIVSFGASKTLNKRLVHSAVGHGRLFDSQTGKPSNNHIKFTTQEMAHALDQILRLSYEPDKFWRNDAGHLPDTVLEPAYFDLGPLNIRV